MKYITNLLPFFAIIKITLGYFDLEDLQNSKYNIDFVKTPVVLPDEIPENAVTVVTKLGQKFHCIYSDRAEEVEKEKEEEISALRIGVKDLLKPLESGPCLFQTKDWWSYEFCFGKYIRQYHMEDNKISGKIIYLGYYESEYNWDNETDNESKSRLNRYHSQYYTNGSSCDVTGKQRRTEVRFICDHESGDRIDDVYEPETCVYVLTIHTMKICHHPYLKPPTKKKATVIQCKPVVTQEQFNIYEEERKEWERDQAEKLKANELKLKEAQKELKEKEKEKEIEKDEKQLNSDSKTSEQIDNIKNSKFSKLQSDIIKGVKEINKANLNNKRDIKEYIKTFTNMKKTRGDTRFKKQRRQKGEEKYKDDYDDEDDESKEEKNKSKMKETDLTKDEESKKGVLTSEEDKENVDEFSKGLKNLGLNDRQETNLANSKSKIKEAVEEQFEDILSEAQEELEKEGVDVKLDKKETARHLSQTLTNLLNVLDEKNNDKDKKKTKDDATESESVDEKVEATDEDLSNINEPQKNDAEGDKGSASSRIQEDFQEKMQNHLKKAGINTDGRKITVKIISSKTGEEIKIGNDEALSKMIIAIWSGDEEEIKEQQREKRFQLSYNSNWKRKSKLFTPPDDSGEVLKEKGEDEET
ncbi:DgyrCDS480 [Dimorphilus gyrociliatus]|uniref:Protein OS-9 n=1 Tax=Dimorphilus gyrociliatus TaxID=2664684 RepID=A0A7I8V6A0_9ANNE|nr:DgyrCDS480 [Dimorphilus gyrociliatus]